MKPHLHCKGCEYLKYFGYGHYIEGFRCTYYMSHSKDGFLRSPELIEKVKKCPKRLLKAKSSEQV